MPVKAVVCKVSRTVWEPAVEEFIGCVHDRLWFLEPVNLFGLLSPELIPIFN